MTFVKKLSLAVPPSSQTASIKVECYDESLLETVPVYEVYTFSMMLIQRTLAFLLVAVFAFGILAYTGTVVESRHTMGDGTTHQVCPLMGGTTSACVNVLEHLAHWQSSFTGIFTELLLFVVLLIAACACLRLFHLDLWRFARAFLTSPPKVPHARSLLPRHVLQEAFSSGILHSKAF